MDQLQKQLEAFASAQSVAELVETGRPFLKTSAAAKAAKSDLFQAGLGKLVQQVHVANGEEQLLAIAYAWRLTSVISMKAHRSFVVESLAVPSPAPTALPTCLVDPDDRKNLAEALRWMDGDWVPEFLVRSIVNEKDGKQARTKSCESLLIRHDNLTSSLTVLGAELRALRLDQKDQNLGRARQLVGCLTSLSEAIWSAADELEVGDDFGVSYSRIIGAIVFAGEISDRSVKVDLVRSAIDFYITLARLSPTLAARAESYSFVSVLKRLFAPADWPDDLSKELNALTKLVSKQLVFLLQVGRADGDLRSTILFLKGEVAGTAYLKNLTQTLDGLSEDDRFWLVKGKGRKTGATDDAIGESALAQFDLDLAYLYRASDLLSSSLGATIQAFGNEADLLPQQTMQRIANYLEKSGEANHRASKIFERRGMNIRGRIGETVEFDPNEHDPSADAIGARVVRLISRIVERELAGGRKIVILKADVEKA